MTFEQTLAITIVGLIICGSAFLMWFARDAYRKIGFTIVGVLWFLLLAAQAVNGIYSAAAGSQWLSDSKAVSDAALKSSQRAQVALSDLARAVSVPQKQSEELIASFPNGSVPDLKRIDAPLPGWVFEVIILLLVVQFVLLLVHATVAIRQNEPHKSSERDHGNAE